MNAYEVFSRWKTSVEMFTLYRLQYAAIGIDKIASIYYIQKYTRMTFYDSHNSWWQPIKFVRSQDFHVNIYAYIEQL